MGQLIWASDESSFPFVSCFLSVPKPMTLVKTVLLCCIHQLDEMVYKVLTLGCKRRMSSIVCWKSGCSYCTRLIPWLWLVLLHILINQAMLVLHGIPFMDTLPPCSPRILVRCLHDGKPPQPCYGSYLVLAQTRYRPTACSVAHIEEPTTVLKHA